MRGRTRLAATLACLAWALPACAVRVGIVVGADDVAVGRRGRDLVVREGDDDAAALRAGPLRLAVRAAASEAAPRRHVVRVRTERDRRKADLVLEGLASALEAPLRVERSGQGWAVVAGPFDSQRRAGQIREQLHSAGMKEAIVVPLEEDVAPSSRLVAVTGAFEVLGIAGERARIGAPDGEPIEVDGRPHRGEIEVSIDGSGRLVVVVSLDVEEYLRGVVPEEMGPELYPVPAALEAQAIAARSYVLRARQHEGEPFDACATAHCQVYGGASSEHPLSDGAVSRTTGLVLVHEGLPALAYFSSTCGGHTEDVADVFEGRSDPYLRGVPCYPDSVLFTTVTGSRIVPDWELVSGPPADEILARLVAADVVSREQAEAAGFTRRASREETLAWVARAAASADATLRPGALEALSTDTVMHFVRSLVLALGWREQGRLLLDQDLAAASRFRVLEGLSGDDLSDALLAMKGGILPTGYQAGWATSRISRGNVLEILATWLATRGRFDSAPVRFVGRAEGGLRVLAGKEMVILPLSSRPVLLAGRKGTHARVREKVDLKVGDKLWIQKDSSGAAALVALEDDPDGAAFDRLSAYSWWSRRIPADQLAKSALSKAGIAGLKDLRVTRVSAGGRIVGLELVGAQSSATLTGFAVRDMLGLPDLRAVLQVERDPSGRLAAIVATGRGWGHGVGLCQTGAHGMALSGRSAAEILAHYYPGTRLERR